MVNNRYCILIVDDEKRIVIGLKDFFKAQGYEVYEAYDGKHALEKYQQHQNSIDLILLDVMMPKMDGFEVVSEIRENNQDISIIMLTAKGQEYDQIKGFQQGADDYITKPFSLSLLLARVEAKLRRTIKNQDQFIKHGSLEIVPAKREVKIKEDIIELTRREYDLLLFLVSNKELILTRQQIVEEVWGYNYEGDIRTVDTHIKQIRIKLKECSSYIKTVHGVGYKFEVLS